AITLEVIMRAIFGVEDAERRERLRTILVRFVEEGTRPLRMLRMLAAGPDKVTERRFFRRLMDPMDETLYDEIGRRRAAPDLAERDDILSLLVQARDEQGKPMTDKELRDQLMTLLVAGHETTATALS